MNLRHMRHFVAVAEEMHFGRAAQRLGMAQPPLSQSIKRLETDLGVELFDRSKRSVELTRAGRTFLAEARRTLLQADLARKMTVRAALQAQELRVSFIGPALYRLLPALLVGYRAVAPEVAVKLFERPSPQQVSGLDAGDFDVGFIAGGTSTSDGHETMVVEQAPYIAAVPADGVFGGRTSLGLAELAEQPFISPPSAYAEQSSRALAMFKSVGLMPPVAQEATQTNTSLSLVGAGLGCSLVMATAPLAGFRNVRFLPIQDEVDYDLWELLMVWRPLRGSVRVNEFVAFVRAFVRDNPGLLSPSPSLSKNGGEPA